MSALYLFRRDFRLKDNCAIYNLYKQKYTKIYFVFIFTPEQTNPKINDYFTESSFKFMLSALQNLNDKIAINFLYGNYIKTIKEILEYDKNIKDIYFNHDYSDYAYSRDVKIFKLGKKKNINIHAYHDLFLTFGILEKGYKVMNAYVKRIQKYKIKMLPNINEKKLIEKAKKLPNSDKLNKLFDTKDLPKLKRNPLNLVRDMFANNKDIRGLSTYVGPYVKFGVVSCRELYLVKTSPAYKREVIIREFFYQCEIFYRKEILNIPDNWVSPYYDKKFRKQLLGKISDEDIIKSFYKKNETFYKLPELIQEFIIKLIDTNHLHNRERMMLASYLLHNLGINWKLCERFYANNLRDYDYVINKLNWLWMLKVFFNTRPNIMKLENFHY